MDTMPSKRLRMLLNGIRRYFVRTKARSKVKRRRKRGVSCHGCSEVLGVLSGVWGLNIINMYIFILGVVTMYTEIRYT